MRTAFAVIACSASLISPRAVGAGPGPKQPNIVLILADDLGINDLGCYGRTDQHTPHVDGLAREGTRFTSFYCAESLCSASRAALLTGQNPARLHLTTYLPGRADAPSQKLLQPKIRQQLPLEEVTLAKVLRNAGYATACFGKWHLGGKGFGPKEQGFDVYFPGRGVTKPSETEGGKGEYELTAHAEQFLNENKSRPFFVYLAHYSPHIPIGAKAALIAKNRDSFNPLYAAVVESLDDCIGRVLKRIDDLGLRDNTIVLFASDNGGLHVPELRDDAPTYNTPFRAGKGFIYEGGLRVPLIVRWPGRIPADKVSAAPIVDTDLMPTLLDLLGIKPQPRPAFDGVSVAPMLLGKGQAPSRPLFWHFPHYSNQGGRPAGAVREGDWKLIEQYEDGLLELYNLANDPGESTDLSAKEPQRKAAMHKKLAGWRQAVGAQMNAPNPSFDPALHRKLYMDTDVSKLKSAKRAAEMTKQLANWRKMMDEVVRRGR